MDLGTHQHRHLRPPSPDWIGAGYLLGFYALAHVYCNQPAEDSEETLVLFSPYLPLWF